MSGEKKFVRGSGSHDQDGHHTHIWGKAIKNFLSVTLGRGMQHRGLGPNKICSNHDLGLTITFLRQGQIYFLMLLYGKIYISSRII